MSTHDLGFSAPRIANFAILRAESPVCKVPRLFRFKKKITLISELNMRERLVTDLRLELERVNNDLVSYKQKYYEMKRALDADEARRLRVPTPSCRCDTA